MEPTGTTVGLSSRALAPLTERLFVPRDPAASGPEPLSGILAFTDGERPVGPGEAHTLVSELFRHSTHGRGRRFTAEERRAIGDALNQSVRALRTLPLTDLRVVSEGHQALVRRLSLTGGSGRSGLSAKGMRVWEALLTAVCAHIVDRLARRSRLVAHEARHQALVHSELIRRSDERLLALGAELAFSDAEFETGHLAALRERNGAVHVAGLTATRPLRLVDVPLTALTPGAPPQPAHRLPDGFPRLLVRGGPGSGKTHLAQAVALAAADPGPDTPPWLRGRIPFPVPLRRLAAQGPPPDTVEEFLATGPGFPIERLHDGWIDRVLAAGRGLVLVDGLDEVPIAVRTATGRRLADLLDAHPATRILVLTRPGAVRGRWLAEHDFTEATLLPLTADRVTELIGRWHPVTPGAAPSLIRLLRSRPRLAEAATDPLVCTALCAQADAHGPLTEHAHLSGITALLLGDRDRARGVALGEDLDRDTCHRAVRNLARRMILDGTRELSARTALDVLAESDGSGDARRVLSHLTDRTGLLRTGPANTVAFTHQAFRDYFRAEAAIAHGGPDALIRHADDPEWYPVLRLAAEADAGQDTLVRRLLEHARTLPDGDRRDRLHALCAELAAGPQTRAEAARRAAPTPPPPGLSTSAAPDRPPTGPAAYAEPPLDDRILPGDESDPANPDPAGAEIGPVAPGRGAMLNPVTLGTGPAEPDTPLVAVALPQPLSGPPLRPTPLPPTPVRPSALAPPPRALRPEPSGGARELAVALSVATRIEPELIRAVRVRILPWLDVGAETDLWFGPWTAARTRAGIALRPALLPGLRAELAARLRDSAADDPLHTLGHLIADIHAGLPPALRLEERAAWIDVSAGAGREEALEEALQPALRALVAEGRDGLADWIAGAWPRLPASVKATVTAWQLATVAAHRDPGRSPAVPNAPAALTPGHVAVLADALPQVPLGLVRAGARLRIGASVPGGAAVPVPDTDPRVIEILAEAEGDGSARTVLVASGAELTVDVGEGPVRLRTPAGAVYELAPPARRKSSPSRRHRGTAADLLRLLESGALGDTRGPGMEQLSLLVALLMASGLHGVEVLGEFPVPGTRTRVDALLAGVHPRTGEPSYAMVELKRSRRAPVDSRSLRESNTLMRRNLDALIRRLPLFRDRPELLDGLVYWHSADVPSRALLGHRPDFAEDSRERAIAWLRERLAPSPGLESGSALLAGEPLPQDPAQFVVWPGQEKVYEKVLRAVSAAGDAHPKEVIVVIGGPGSGRTAVALALLRELRRQGASVRYTTGSPQLTGALRALSAAAPREAALFDDNHLYYAVGAPSGFDVLLCDEAQRIEASPPPPGERHRFGESARGRAGRLIRAARVPVFLMDQEDTGHPGEAGSFAAVAGAATNLGFTVREIDLDDLGAGTHRAYRRWVSWLLGLRAESAEWDPRSRTPSLLLADGPRQLEAVLTARMTEGHSARITAGACWAWHPPRHGGSLSPDVRIGDWALPWAGREKRAPGVVPWAVDPDAAGQVGGVEYARGFEFDWCGVLIGPDLVWRDGDWVTDRRASHDTAIRRASREDADGYIRRAYLSLLTRGLLGTVVHSTDEETRARLAELIPGVPGVPGAPGHGDGPTAGGIERP
ncbi:DNA/RNA helicase domain-containing protein [Streptomyces yaizuensis]|uniref:DUF2075 domain-containing protein n=1 Tax=Streptomyces yaizuensis TaxID=2989713 RepID=A0ABQ5NYI1_9ACTN|nr:DNA/RNA helicase domain-containing protein [Streptomyces sp. YSPA8]GLF95419.1 DUF2075 domain-containing protein [Streptomyces sp. YSPA8]